MISPNKVQSATNKKEDENLEFRMFLKCHADEAELDEQFKKLHNQYFENYDCKKCRNCCKKYYGSIPSEDIEKDAKYLAMTSDEFIKRSLIEEDFIESNEIFAYIVGYTSGGEPYGITWEEMEEIERRDKILEQESNLDIDLPF